MKKQINIGFIGLGCRGYGLLSQVLLKMHNEGVNITAVCDLYEDRTADGAKWVEEQTGVIPFTTTDYREVIKRVDVDAVIISSSWESHIEIAVACMEAGKPVATEVGGAYDINDCWKLVETFERTGVHCMLLENCCYGETELTVLNMVRSGIFGEIVHCEGGYMHDLRSEVAGGVENRHYRLRNYLNRCCENYPTHELGPIAKVLNINNGNRMLTLTSTASCSKGMNTYIAKEKGAEHPLASAHFAQGDVITTVIKCAGGQTITLILDTTLPRTYSRHFTIRGTLGAYFEDTNSVFIDGKHNEMEFDGKKLWDNFEEYKKDYLHPLWKDYSDTDVHGGIDTLVMRAFIDSVINGTKPPLDTYDTASFMCISALSEQSIARGSIPVSIPDFTRGKWYMRDDIVDNEYNLDLINP